MVSKSEVQRIKDSLKGTHGERTLSRHAVELAQGKRYLSGQLGLDSSLENARKFRKDKSTPSF